MVCDATLQGIVPSTRDDPSSSARSAVGQFSAKAALIYER
jgi:phage baseplate assembly protein gpV